MESIDGLTPPVAIVVAAVVASADDITTSVAEGRATLLESVGLVFSAAKGVAARTQQQLEYTRVFHLLLIAILAYLHCIGGLGSSDCEWELH